MKKGQKMLLKVWNLITNVVMHILALVLGTAMATGELVLTGITWLAWIEPAVVPVGYVIIGLTVLSAVVTFIEFFTK